MFDQKISCLQQSAFIIPTSNPPFLSSAVDDKKIFLRKDHPSPVSRSHLLHHRRTNTGGGGGGEIEERESGNLQIIVASWKKIMMGVLALTPMYSPVFPEQVGFGGGLERYGITSSATYAAGLNDEQQLIAVSVR